MVNKGTLYAGAAVLLGAGVLIYVARKQVAAAADTVGGVVSGNNAVTEGTVYEGAGIAGTLGAAANAASGGTLEKVGHWLGDKLFDAFGPKYDADAMGPNGYRAE